MGDFFSAGAAGFFISILVSIVTYIAAVESWDINIDRIKAALAVCEQANSTLVSLDWTEATCANKAVIPYEVKK